jgi:hypothetical protein
MIVRTFVLRITFLINMRCLEENRNCFEDACFFNIRKAGGIDAEKN